MRISTKKLFGLNIILLLIWSSCSYTPEEEYFKQLSPPATNNISLDDAIDTIFLFEKKSFTYSLEAPEKKVYTLGVNLGDDYVSSKYENGKIVFELDPTEFTNGIHPLTIYIRFSGGTGSLADRLGSEIVHFQKQFFVNLDISPPTKIDSPEIAIVDGRLMIEWDPSEKKNFYGYKVLKFYKDKNNFQRADTVFSGGQEVSSFHDEFYTGGAVSYRVDIFGYKYYVPGEEKAFSADPINIKLHFIDDHTVKLNWKDFTLYNNSLVFKLYKTNKLDHSISHSVDGGYDLNQTISPEKEGEIVLKFEEAFGNPELYKLAVVPANQNWYNSNWWTETHEIGLGTKFHSFEAIAFDQSAKKMYLIYHPGLEKSAARLVRYNLLSMQPEDSTDLQLNDLQKILVSENGQYLYIEDKSDTEVQLQHINPHTLDLQEIIYLSDLVGPIHQDAKVTSVSNNNLIAFNNFENYAVLDLNQKVISWQNNPDVYRTIQIYVSPDGKYFFQSQLEFAFKNPYTNASVYHTYGYIHQWQNNSWNNLGKLYMAPDETIQGFKNTTEKGFFFMDEPANRLKLQVVSDGALGDTKFYQQSDESIRIKSYNSFQDAFHISSYSGFGTTNLSLYNYETEEKSMQLEVNAHFQYGFYENMYFASSGYYYVVQE